MKFEKVKYTCEYNGHIKANEWISIDVILEGDETPEMGLDAAKQKIEGWQSKNGGGIYQLGTNGEPPIINRAHERLLELIEDAKTKEELVVYQNNVGSSRNQHIVDAYNKKMSILIDKEK